MIKRKIAGKVLSWILIVSLAASLAGCGSKNGEKRNTESSYTESNNTGSETKAKSDHSVPESNIPKGRYVESNIPLPFEDGQESVSYCAQRPDGGLELYTIVLEEGDIAGGNIYIYDGTDWVKEEEPWSNHLPKDRYFSYVTYGPDQSRYGIYNGEEYKTRIVKMSPDGSYEELDALRDVSMVGVNGIYVMEDGTLLVPESDVVHVIAPDGSEKNKLPQVNSYSNYCDSHTLTPNSFITCGEKGFLRYDTATWKEKEVIPFQTGAADNYGSLAAGKGEDFYLCNPAGIHHMMENGTMWETVVDGSLNSLGMPSVTITKLFVGQENDFYVLYNEGETGRLAHYTYDSDMPSVPSKKLTVYGLDLDSCQTIRQAASLFQMENPDVRVELIDGGRESGAVSKSDTIRSLNAELLNGKGADVLVLDGLPYRSYVEKGILEDLSDIIEPMAQSGEIYENIAESFKEAGGEIYQFPIRVSFPIVYGQTSQIDRLKSMDELLNYQKANPDQQLFARTVYENILRQMVYIYYPELVSKDTGELIPGQMEKLLETAMAVGTAAGCKTVFGEEEDNGYGEFYNRVYKEGVSFNALSMYQLYSGELPFSIELPSGMTDMMYPFTVSEKFGYEIQSLNRIYYTNGLLGVTNFGEEKETARKFVEFAVSLKVQESDLSDGLPVNRKAAAAWEERDSNISMGMGFGSEEPLYAEYPDQGKRKQFMALLAELKTPVSIDEVLLEMIINETKGYFEGTQDAKSAARAVENKAKLYYSE